jgi:hypothetical protein
MDADAAAYITAVETADGQALEEKVKIAIDNFVLGCKADGIWSAIKSSCILAGARTRLGALTPLVGAAPTNFNFVDGDYNRKTGLVGDGTTKYLNSNRNNNSDPQNSRHICVLVSSAQSSGGGTYVGAGTFLTGDSGIVANTSTASIFARLANASVAEFVGGHTATGFVGASRAASSSFVFRYSGTNNVVSQASQTPSSTPYLVFARNVAPPDTFSNARLAFYSIGESLNLALLDARVTDLINAFGAAIP